jgi:hypothetical protein
VGISNGRRVLNVRETTECGRACQLVVAVGDFHTAVGLSDSLRRKQQRMRVMLPRVIWHLKESAFAVT